MIQVSVVIPAYNCSSTIEACLKSIMDQTLKPYEIIVVNDGSKDNTRQVCENFAGEITLINQVNQGVSAARNAGVKHATGTWVAFLDSDDHWLEDRLESQAELLVQYPDLQWVSGRFNKCSDNKTQVSAFQSDGDVQGQYLILDALDAMAAQTTTFWTGTMLLKRSCLEKVGEFDTNMKNGEDVDVWVRFAIEYPQIGFVNRPIADYTVDQPGSLTGQAAQVIETDKFKFYQKLKSHVDQASCEKKSEACRVILASYIGRYVKNLFRQGLHHEAKSVLQWARDHKMPQVPFKYKWMGWLPSAFIKFARRLKRG